MFNKYYTLFSSSFLSYVHIVVVALYVMNMENYLLMNSFGCLDYGFAKFDDNNTKTTIIEFNQWRK